MRHGSNDLTRKNLFTYPEASNQDPELIRLVAAAHGSGGGVDGTHGVEERHLWKNDLRAKK
jgi:hypothetical protein